VLVRRRLSSGAIGNLGSRDGLLPRGASTRKERPDRSDGGENLEGGEEYGGVKGCFHGPGASKREVTVTKLTLCSRGAARESDSEKDYGGGVSLNRFVHGRRFRRVIENKE